MEHPWALCAPQTNAHSPWRARQLAAALHRDHLNLAGHGVAGVEAAAGLLCLHAGTSGSADDRMHVVAWLVNAAHGDPARCIPRHRRVGSFLGTLRCAEMYTPVLVDSQGVELYLSDLQFARFDAYSLHPGEQTAQRGQPKGLQELCR